MRYRSLLFFSASVFVLLWSSQSFPDPPSQRELDRLIVQTLRRDGTCLFASSVVVCASAHALREQELREFLALAQDGALRIRSHLGRQLDLPGDDARRVEFFISAEVGIPHVTIHREPWIFIHPRAVRKRMAPYLHEMVHAMAQWSWRNSEWVGEGFANHVAAAVAVGHPGYNRSFILPSGLDDLHELRRSEAGRAVVPLIGLPGRRHTYAGEARRLAELLRSERREYAPPYYAMSWSFVSYLVSEIGYAGLRSVAESRLPSETLRGITGKSMAEHLSAWGRGLGEVHGGHGQACVQADCGEGASH